MELARLGYTANSAAGQVSVVAHLSRWMAREQLDAVRLVEPIVERYMAARRAAGYSNYGTAQALHPLLTFLRGVGVEPPRTVAVLTPVDALLERYRQYLIVERGLSVRTARGYVDAVRPFVTGRAGVRGLDLAGLTAGDVTAFVLAACPGLAIGSAKMLRRAMGYRLARPEKLLNQFLGYLDEAGADTVTVAHALGWARLPAGGERIWWAYRLSAVRGFARYLHTLDPATEVPPTDLLPSRACRANPYLYSDDDITALIAAAASLRTTTRQATFQTLIGLLSVTRMRVGEVITPDRGDVDLTRGLLLIRHAKFGKSRELVVHASTVDALRRYLRHRDRLDPAPSTPAVFVSTAGTRLRYCNVRSTWQRLCATPGSHRVRRSVGPGFMTYAMPSPSRPCSMPTPPGRTARPRRRCCRPTSGTSTRRRPTGISPPRPNCSPSSGSGSRTTSRTA